MPVPALWLQPNVDVVDSLYVLSHPDEFTWLWDLITGTGGGWKFHDANVLPHWHTDQRPDPLVTVEKLTEIEAFKTLKKRGVRTSVALGAIKPWNQNGETCRDNARLAVDTIVAAGGDVPGLDIDEPWTWSLGGSWVPRDPYYSDANGQPRYRFVAALVATFIRELRDHGVTELVMSESVPNNQPTFFVDRYREVINEGQHLDGWLWDVESGMNYLRSNVGKRAIRNATDTLMALGVPSVGYIVCPNGHRETEPEFTASMLAMNDVVHGVTAQVSTIDLTSWHCKTSEHEGSVLLTLPGLLPGRDQTGMLPTFRKIAESWGVVFRRS